MSTNVRNRVTFIILLVLASVYVLIAYPKFPRSWQDVKANVADRLKLGLDLQGGTHLILQVQVQDAIRLYTDQTADQLQRILRDEKNIRFGSITQPSASQILITDIPAESDSAFKDAVKDALPNWDMAPAAGTPPGYLLTMRASTEASIRTTTMQQSVETIRRRIDQLGLTEPEIREHGRSEDEILVQLPGEGDPARAKAIIQAGGQLELRLMHGERPYSSEAEARNAFPGGVFPAGTELVKGRAERDITPGSTPAEAWYLLDKRPAVTGRDLRNATTAPSTERPGSYKVLFSLSTEAGRRFGTFTEANVGRNMAIVLDSRVYSAPVINSRIEDQGRIQGRFGMEEARDLALVLRAGSLPASIKYLEERTVGPSLGADSIRQGFRASVGSLIVVMIFMVWYYRVSGWNAVVALILNLLLLLAAMAALRGTLTLPGIAGIILTIGMGVDTSVLVFERIREELRHGKAAAAAVEAGFNNAFRTILDTHVTTIVSCMFLGAFGTGPIRGFALTLIIGLLANLVTGVFISRTIFQWHLGRMSREATLSI
jgi:preprotein translocase subunit SecD